jgi:hypothetical protein
MMSLHPLAARFLFGASLFLAFSSPVCSYLPVLALSQGVETPGGRMTTVTQRGTTLSGVLSRSFTTCVDNQTSVQVAVYEGEQPMTGRNLFLGSIIVHGMIPSPYGIAVIDVAFENYELPGNDRCFDGSGATCIWRLRVSVTERSNGRNEKVQFDLTTSGGIRNRDKTREPRLERHLEEWSFQLHEGGGKEYWERIENASEKYHEKHFTNDGEEHWKGRMATSEKQGERKCLPAPPLLYLPMN